MSPQSTITVRVPLTIRRRHGRKVMFGSDGERVGGCVRADPALVKALARAFRWKRMLDEGRYASVSDIAAAEKIDRGYVGSVLRLTLLAPDIVEAILSGRAGLLGLPKLLEPFPPVWSDQRSALQQENTSGDPVDYTAACMQLPDRNWSEAEWRFQRADTARSTYTK